MLSHIRLLFALLFFFADGEDASDDDATDDNDATDRDDTEATNELGDKGKEALKREREARRTAEKARSDLEKRISDFEKQQRDAEEKAAKEAGEWEKVATAREDELTKLKADLADRDLMAQRATIARKHNLPDDAVKYLTGDDEESIEAAAKDLARLTVRSEDVDTDSGKRNSSTSKKKQDDSILVNYKFGQRR